MFLYRVTRNYLGWAGRGDTGAFVRSAIKALKIFGAVPEAYWPYNERQFDAEPEAFHYAFAQSLKALEYFRLVEEPQHLRSVLDAGIPFAFGFTCFSSLDAPETARTGIIPYPTQYDSVVGGHAVLAVGYTDTHVLVRNSWGPAWGEQGYGYLPWSYFDAGTPLATDCWALINASWLEPDEADGQIQFSAGKRSARGLETKLRPPAARDEFLVVVREGQEPEKTIPLKLSRAGVRATDDEAPTPVATTPSAVSLYLKNVLLKESFDWALFGKAVNELYVVAVAWDLSGKPPEVFPAPAASALKGTSSAVQGDVIRFVGDGLPLWPSQPVVGALNVRILVLENDDDVRRIGERIEAIRSAVDGSKLTQALAALVAGATAGTVLAVAAAAAELMNGLGVLLRANGDDAIGLFDGAYGAERISQTTTSRYEQRGCAIELELVVK